MMFSETKKSNQFLLEMTHIFETLQIQQLTFG